MKNFDKFPTITVVYKSKDKYCKDTILGETSDPDVQCSNAISSQILFEVYRREIIMEFNSLLEELPTNSASIVYGQRYDYYQTNLFDIDETRTNYFKANNTTHLVIQGLRWHPQETLPIIGYRSHNIDKNNLLS